MSSILTNTSAMVALQTLKGINSGLETTQNEIATGKTVATAKDNASIWAISKVMEADVSGLSTISDNLSLAESAVAVASTASESVQDLLAGIKDKIIAAQSDIAGRDELQTDITRLREQIATVVEGAQYNGVNFVNGSTETTNVNGARGLDFLSSLDRNSSGQVNVNEIGVDAQNLTTNEGVGFAAIASGTVAAAGSTATFTVGFMNEDGTAGATEAGFTSDPNAVTGTNLAAGDVLRLTIDDNEVTYTVAAGDTAAEVTAGLNDALSGTGLTDYNVALTGADIEIANNGIAAADIGVDVERNRGSLADLSDMDVTTQEGAEQALADIEGMIQASIDAATSFGSTQNRIEIQNNFISKLSDSLKAGIGAMVDADMEEASARLQALQVQQQLGVQSLSIANQAPQTILSLFR
ncbi:flagellin [Qingshengfaniella alkalisoli]|uniref:Flagellin n=1 Tax=Qingshengfaniella alkalisoli TaxID=2599296 RepID=A0A5B8IX45_9RHOB|nr:flagellin [Qingshengfaniella alkalisoli]QDY70163.1 flagellin [Qingshengfaniella alkalisoli]